MDDDELGARLRGLVALAERDEPPPDDLFDEVVRTGTRVRRLRALGGATAVTAVVVAGVVLAPQLWAARPPQAAVPAASRAAAPVAHYTWTDWPTPTPTSPPPSNAVAIPDVLPAEDELDGMQYSKDSPLGDPNLAPAFGLQVCDPSVVDSPPAADVSEQLGSVLGSAWTPDQARSVDITVSVWEDGRGWQQMVDDDGTCQWSHVEPRTWPRGEQPDDAIYLEGTFNAHQAGLVRRVGRVVVSVVVFDSSDERAQSQAFRLSDLVLANIEAADWSWAKDR